MPVSDFEAKCFTLFDKQRWIVRILSHNMTEPSYFIYHASALSLYVVYSLYISCILFICRALSLYTECSLYLSCALFIYRVLCLYIVYSLYISFACYCSYTPLPTRWSRVRFAIEVDFKHWPGLLGRPSLIWVPNGSREAKVAGVIWQHHPSSLDRFIKKMRSVPYTQYTQRSGKGHF